MQNSMDYGKAFTYPTLENNWIVKVLIGAAITIIPLFGNIVLAGYTLEVTRRVINGEAQVLPEWADFGGLFKKGLYAFVVGFVYALPVIVLAVCTAVPTAVMGGQDNQTMQTAGAIISSCFGCLIALYAVALGLVLPAAFARLAATGEMSAAFRVGEVIALVRAKPGVYVIVWLLSGLAVLLLSSIGSIACGIGALVGAAYAMLVSAHLHGQAYRIATGQGGVTPDAPAAA